MLWLPARLAQTALTLKGELARLSLHTVSSGGPTDPSELLAGLCEFWKHWKALGELLILLQKKEREWKHLVASVQVKKRVQRQ